MYCIALYFVFLMLLLNRGGTSCLAIFIMPTVLLMPFQHGASHRQNELKEMQKVEDSVKQDYGKSQKLLQVCGAFMSPMSQTHTSNT